MRKINQMHYHEKDGVGWLTFPALEQYPGLLHAFSTREGGVSEGEFRSMNLGFRRGDTDENVRENYRRFCAAVGFPPGKLVASSQDHHTFLRRVTSKEAGIGIDKPRDMESVDGLCTDEPGVTLVTYYADCVPLYFYDPEHRAAALAHAGWRGTAAEIGEKMVKKMAVEFGSRPKDLIAAIGPSIGPCCYEVDAPVAGQFLSMEELEPCGFVTEKGGGKYMLDLWECNRRILLTAGLLPEHVSVGRVCTKCHSDLLYSHRVMGANRGSLAAMICLLE